MRVIIDSKQGALIQEENGQQQSFSLYSPESFNVLSRLWLKVGWQQKYSYSFSWMGRPIIQLPEDVLRIQSLIHHLQPDVIVETGIAHGGSLILYASLCKTLEKGRVVGVDIEIRPHNRKAIESHPLASYITLIEGSSTDPNVVGQVKNQIKPGEKVLILLDSCHSKAHVLAELKAYASLVTLESYIVATDGIMEDLAEVPGGADDWSWNNPQQAVHEFLKDENGFVLEEPADTAAPVSGQPRITYWPSAFLRRVA